MTNEDRINAIEKRGYTDRQAAFLCLVALHGGYFLRRQYNAFLGLEPGGTAERLIEKAILKGHVRAHQSANQTVIYHVGNKAFFEVIGEEDNRNRRWRQPYSIKIKLMGLDYVLAHRDHHYLATESEKLDYFTARMGLNPDCLPFRIYRSKDGRLTTARYFVDKFPLFLSGASTESTAPRTVVSFCYVDGNSGKPSGFDTYLLQYRDLWARLTSFRVVYIASDPRMFPKAERIFSRLCGHFCDGALDAAIDPELGRQLDHFRSRDLFERRETASFDRRRLDQLRDELEEFGGLEYEASYRRWKEDGDAAVVGTAKTQQAGPGSFATYQLAHEYNLFGDLVRVVPA